MNDLHKLARIILVALGTYLLLTYGVGIFATLPYLFSGQPQMRSFAIKGLVSFAMLAVCLGLVIYALICRADLLSSKIIGIHESDQTSVWWLPFAFRLAAVCAALMMLSRSIFALTSTIVNYIGMMALMPAKASISWHVLVASLIQLALAIYLLCGAPHFVRWQVRKTLEHCERWEEPDDAYDEEE
jgi:hypothetical protein